MRECGAECVAVVGTFAVCEPADRSRTDGRLRVVVYALTLATATERAGRGEWRRRRRWRWWGIE